MGWKSTKEISREKSIKLIYDRIEDATNDELGNTLESLGFGDNTELPYYGYNFSVGDDFDDDYGY